MSLNYNNSGTYLPASLSTLNAKDPKPTKAFRGIPLPPQIKLRGLHNTTQPSRQAYLQSIDQAPGYNGARQPVVKW